MGPRAWLISSWCAVALAVTACGASPPPTTISPATPAMAATPATATPAPSATPTATATATPSPTPTPAPSPTPSPTSLPTATVTAAATATPSARLTPAPATAGPRPVEIGQALAAFDALTSYRVRGTLDSKESGKTSVLLEYVAPDRRHVVLGTLEIIVIGTTSYVKQGEAWLTLEGRGAGMAALAPDARAIARQFEHATFTARGLETIDGEPCAVFSYAEGEQRGAIWIGTRDKLIRKIEGSQPTGSYSLVLSDFNQPIEIRPPV